MLKIMHNIDKKQRINCSKITIIDKNAVITCKKQKTVQNNNSITFSRKQTPIENPINLKSIT